MSSSEKIVSTLNLDLRIRWKPIRHKQTATELTGRFQSLHGAVPMPLCTAAAVNSRWPRVLASPLAFKIGAGGICQRCYSQFSKQSAASKVGSRRTAALLRLRANRSRTLSYQRQENKIGKSRTVMPVEASVAASEASAANRPTGDGRKAHRNGCGVRIWKQFSKQETPGHRTIFSLRFAIIIFACMCVAFLVGGGVLLSISLQQVQIKVTYSDVDQLAGLTNPERSMLMQGIDPRTGEPQAAPLESSLQLTLDEDMAAPIHVYYVLEDFFQNHKRYVRSVDYNQLHGVDVSASALDSCIPQKFIGNSRSEFRPEDGLMNPCGLTAWSLFNDSFLDFQVLRDGSAEFEALQLDQSDLVWDSDRETFFGDHTPVNHNTVPQYRGGRALDPNVSLNEDELFMGWMRPAAHPTVRKFYGLIDEDLQKGDQLVFTVVHRYNTYDFNGEKSLLFTTQSAFGSRNLTFGLVWLVMGVLCGIITVTYIILGREQLMDPSLRRANLERWWMMGARPRS